MPSEAKSQAARKVPAAFKTGMLLALAIYGLAGCQQFFTTSLASGLARTSLPIPSNLSTSQAADLAAQAQSNPKLASALVASLVNQIGSTSDPAAKASLQASAASAAVAASGTTAPLISTLKDYIATNVAPSGPALQSLLATIQSGASGTGVVEALLYLDPSPAAGGLSADQAQAAGIGATDLAVAAVVIAASVIPLGSDPSTYFTDPATVLTLAQKDKLDSAKSMLAEANTLSAGNSSSSSLLSQISSQFSL